MAKSLGQAKKIETISDRINGLTLALQGAVGDVARLEAEATCGGELGTDGVAVALALAEMLTADLRRLPRVRSARPAAEVAPAPEQPPLQRIEPDPQLAAVRAELAELREQLVVVLAERDQVRRQRDGLSDALTEARAAGGDHRDARLTAEAKAREAEADLAAAREQLRVVLAERGELQAELEKAAQEAAQSEALSQITAERDQAQADLAAVREQAQRREASLTESEEENERLRGELAQARRPVQLLPGVPVLEAADEVPAYQVGRVGQLAQSVARRDRVYQASDDGGDDAAEDLWARVTLGERLAQPVEVPPPAPPVRRLNGTRRNGVATHARPGAQP